MKFSSDTEYLFLFTYYYFQALLGLCCFMGFFLVVASGGYFLVAVRRLLIVTPWTAACQAQLLVMNLPANAGDLGLVPGSGRPPGGGNSNPLQYSCRKNILQAILHRIYHRLYYMGSQRLDREGNGNPLQYSCLENPMDGGGWQAAVHGIAKSRTRLK